MLRGAAWLWARLLLLHLGPWGVTFWSLGQRFLGLNLLGEVRAPNFANFGDSGIS